MTKHSSSLPQISDGSERDLCCTIRCHQTLHSIAYLKLPRFHLRKPLHLLEVVSTKSRGRSIKGQELNSHLMPMFTVSLLFPYGAQQALWDLLFHTTKTSHSARLRAAVLHHPLCIFLILSLLPFTWKYLMGEICYLCYNLFSVGLGLISFDGVLDFWPFSFIYPSLLYLLSCSYLQ